MPVAGKCLEGRMGYVARLPVLYSSQRLGCFGYVQRKNNFRLPLDNGFGLGQSIHILYCGA
jgi:hypothetical protein